MKIKIVVLIVISLMIITFIISFSSAQNWFYHSPSFTGVDLEKNEKLKNSDFTQDKLNEITKYIKDNSKTTSMIVLQNGKVVYEYGDASEISYIASCRKSVLSMLYGKYIENGTIDLQETIGSLGIDEEDGLLPKEKEATVNDIITSRSGVFHIPANGGYDIKNILKRGSVQHGEYYVYNNWDFNVAGYILEKKSGKSVYEEIEEQLALPLGFQDWNIKNQKRTVNKNKSQYSAYHIYISTRDMAKIGQLMLNGGKWDTKQLIAKDWIKKITSTITSVDTINKRERSDKSSPVQFSYGYMWWIFERFFDNTDFEGAYTASGYAGQYITVIPKRNVVIAHKTRMDLLTFAGLSERGMTSSWQYWLILKKLMQKRENTAISPHS